MAYVELPPPPLSLYTPNQLRFGGFLVKNNWKKVARKQYPKYVVAERSRSAAQTKNVLHVYLLLFDTACPRLAYISRYSCKYRLYRALQYDLSTHQKWGPGEGSFQNRLYACPYLTDTRKTRIVQWRHSKFQ